MSPGTWTATASPASLMTTTKPYLLDTQALAVGIYGVLDINHKTVKEFDTLEEAEAFVAEANGVTVETIRGESIERGRMMGEYLQNLRRARRQVK